MSESTPRPLPAVRQARDKTIARLCEHFARDHIDADELERRIDLAHVAVTPAELDAIVGDLPALAPAAPSSGLASVTHGPVESRQTVVALMGGVERKGPWTPARTVHVFTMWGGAELDFREARFPPGTTQVHILALMGGVEIIVPPGVHVSCDGIGIMGGFTQAGETGAAEADPGAPSLRITGVAIMGGVDVTERRPGETEREAKQRRKRERRLRGGGGHRLGPGEGPDA